MLTLKNKNITLIIAPEYGSNMVSFKVGKQELIYCDQKLLENHDFTGNFVLWPFPNRVRNRCCQFNHRQYSLTNVSVPRGNFPLIHGLVRDEIWQFTALNNTLTTGINITPKSRYWDCWPWSSRLTLKYTLKTDSVRIAYAVANFAKTELGFGFALHPLFKNVKSIKIPAKYVMEADADLLPTGKLLPANLNQLTSVVKLNLDHVFTGLTGNQQINFNHGRRLTIKTSSDFTHCVVYTAEKEKFICVESQTCSTDAHNLDSQGLTSLAHLIRVKPGGIHHGWIEYQIN